MVKLVTSLGFRVDQSSLSMLVELLDKWDDDTASDIAQALCSVGFPVGVKTDGQISLLRSSIRKRKV